MSKGETAARCSVAIFATTLLAALTGCASEEPAEDRSDTTSTSLPSVSASEALARGGLTLPSTATAPTAESIDVFDSQWSGGYRVSFTVPRSAALLVCKQAGLTGDLPSAGLTDDEKTLMGPDFSEVEGMRICSGQWPQDTTWQRQVVIAPDDPANVRIATVRMGR